MAHRYPLLPAHVAQSLKKIEPSWDGDLSYFPCSVTIASGEIFDTVYIVPEKPYLQVWGVFPENDQGKRWVAIENVAGIRESPTRLPARFANELYRQGESGMGYTIFTIVFSDGERQACVTGNAR